MSDYPPPPPPPPAGGPPPPPPPPPGGPGGYGSYGAPMQQQVGLPRPGELLDRFLARLIDGIAFAVVYFILAIIFAAVLVSDPSVNLSDGTYDDGSRVLYNIVFSVVVTALQLGYFAYLESSRGQTLGKMAMKLRVFGPDHQSNPTFQQALKRNIWLAIGLLGILGTLGSVLSFFGGIAAIVFIVIGINSLPNRQTKFDEFAGGTQVMKIG